MIINPYDIAKLNRQHPGAVLRQLEKGEQHKAGSTYWCGYWHQSYTVEQIRRDVPIWGTLYRCRWDDGRVTEHATPLDPRRDAEILC